MSLISTWSTVANANGTLGSTPFYWPEGQAPSTVNDCARLMMATIRTQWNDAIWFNWGYTVTRVSGTSFTVVTASWNTVTLPAAFEANGRIKLYDTSTLYGTIATVSASAASTLVTFTPDAGSLTASFSSVANSIIPATNSPIPGLTIPTDVVTQKTQQIFGIDSGATNSAVITLSPVLTSYTTGQMLTFKAANANTGAMNLNVNSLGAIAIKKLGGSANVAVGDILSGQTVTVVYDGTNFEMQSQIANTGSAGTGDYVLIATHNASSSSTIEFNNLSLLYSQYKLFIDYVDPTTNGANLLMRMSTNNGVSYDSGANYYWCNTTVSMAGSPATAIAGGSADTSITILPTLNNPGNHSVEITIYDPASGGKNTMLNTNGIFSAGGTNYNLNGGALYNNTTAVNAVQFLMSSSTILTGTFKLYGILA